MRDAVVLEEEEGGKGEERIDDPERARRAIPATRAPMTRARRLVVLALVALAGVSACVAYAYGEGSEREDVVLGFILASAGFFFAAACAWLGKSGRTRVAGVDE